MTVHVIWDLPLDPDGIDVQLADGSPVRIRPGRKGDGAALRAAFERFSEQSRYFRFFTPMKALSEDAERRLTDIDDVNQLAWAVFDPSRPSEVGDGSGFAIAAARLFIDEHDPSTAEVTLAVVDEYHGRGLAKILVELLVSTASVHGLSTIRFDTLAENRPVRGLLASIGAHGHQVPDDPAVIRYDLEVPPIDDADATIGALYVLLRTISDATD